VADLYAKLGFTQTLGQGAEQRWELDLARFTPFDVPMADASESGAADAAVKASA
jgi:hypothetical protein